MTDTTRLLPFLWLHGESEEALRQGVRDHSARLLLEDVSGSVSLWVDGQLLGHRDAPPYRFPARLSEGTHRLTLEVVNTLVFRHRDRLSTFNYIKPSGLTGAVTCLKRKA